MERATFLPIFVLHLSADTCQMHHVTLRPWLLILEVTALVADAGLRAPSVYQVWSSCAFPFGRYCAFTVWALGLVNLNLTFDLWIGSRLIRVTGFHPANFGLRRPFRSRVRSRHATDRQTDGRTDGQTDTDAHFIMHPSIRWYGAGA